MKKFKNVLQIKLIFAKKKLFLQTKALFSRKYSK